MTDEAVIADLDGSAEVEWNGSALIAGRSCRDALARVCRWHVERGLRGVQCGSDPAR